MALNASTLKGWSVSAKICFPWAFVYYPLRLFMFLVKAKPENTLWRVGDALKLKAIAQLPDSNKLFYRPLTWDHECIKEVYSYSDYDKVFSPQDGAVVVDAGAHIGAFSIKAARKVGKKGHVIAAEPNKYNYSFLSNNKEINGFSNMYLIYGALSNYSGKTKLYTKKGHSGMFSIIEHYKDRRGVEVPVFTIDEVINELGLDHIDFLKIDTEGAEMPIIKGGVKTLARSKAHIVIAGYHRADNPTEIMGFLNSLGYNTRVAENRFIYGWKN